MVLAPTELAARGRSFPVAAPVGRCDWTIPSERDAHDSFPPLAARSTAAGVLRSGDMPVTADRTANRRWFLEFPRVWERPERRGRHANATL